MSPRRPEAKPPTVRCAIYTRKSTSEGLEQAFNTLDAQREAAEAYIQSQKHEGWVCLPDRYDDGGYSGATMDRPALKRLLADVEAGKIDCILVYKVDRLSRSLGGFGQIIEIFDKHEVAFVSVSQSFNTTSPEGRLMLGILSTFSEFERRLIAVRTRDKMSAARKKGKWTGGVPIVGYDVVDSKLTVNAEEAKRVRAIFDLYAERQSLIETVQELNRIGWTIKRWTTKTGKERGGNPFTRATLFGLLTSVTYVGKVRHNGSVYEGEHEGIVEERVWQRVQKLLRRNGTTRGRATRNKHGALLRGLLWCGSCGVRMIHSYTRKSTKLYRYYTCSNAQRQGWDTCRTKSIPAAEIERFLVDRIRCIGKDPNLLAEVLARVRAQVENQTRDLDLERRAVERELKQHAAHVKRLAGRKNGNARASRLAELQDQTAAAERRLAKIREEQATLQRENVDEAELAAVLRNFAPLWDSLSPRERARILQLLIERVSYDREEERIAIAFRPSGISVLAEEVAE